VTNRPIHGEYGAMTALPKSEQKRILCGRLKALREDSDFTQEYVARRIGAARDAYAKYEFRSVIPPDLAVKAAELFDVSPLYLLSVDAVKEKFASGGQSVPAHFASTIRVELIGAVEAGRFKKSIEWPPEDREFLQVPANIPYADKPLKAFQVVGPSMEEWYPDGTYLVVCPSLYLGEGWIPTAGQHVIVQRLAYDEAEATVKEVAYEGDDLLLWPRSRHPDFQKPWRIPIRRNGVAPADDFEGVRITGLVIWAMRRAPGT
jgi:transcriptional regulator with XRE-family HTH domain